MIEALTWASNGKASGSQEGELGPRGGWASTAVSSSCITGCDGSLVHQLARATNELNNRLPTDIQGYKTILDRANIAGRSNRSRGSPVEQPYRLWIQQGCIEGKRPGARYRNNDEWFAFLNALPLATAWRNLAAMRSLLDLPLSRDVVSVIVTILDDTILDDATE
eukprot:SAG31_NODE_18501_length_633_cov_2.194757_2_plen_165_part_01